MRKRPFVRHEAPRCGVLCYNINMKIEITPEMLEEARKKKQQESQQPDIVDPGTENICIGCE